ncbi:HVA22-like protein k [Rutidosis leptorrhynchoides]|uniref:HVA22-like protein k n=1 Tax=Rutidosis leptorrhynchoides TaxID=125765 RepID=UPI003A99734D
MALLSMTSQRLMVGLQLLLSPLGSNVVTRAACCSIGIGLPVYSTFKAIENKDQNEQQKWLVYWAVYGSFSVVEVFADKILSSTFLSYPLLKLWIPLYYHVKFAFLVWLQLPTANGAKQLYEGYLRPFLSRHRVNLDQLTEFVNCRITSFVIAHQGEIQFARELFMKSLKSANQMIGDIIRPAGGQSRGAFQGPSRRIQDSEPDNNNDQSSDAN